MKCAKDEDVNFRIIEVKRAVKDFVNKLDCMSSRGELNSDGIKALIRIVKMLNELGMRSEAERLSRRLRKGELEAVLSLLYQLEEKLS